MRRADITPELIELSKRAKELGFPQDVEKGDWYGYVTYTDELFVLGAGEMICGVETEETKLYLILSFSRCLEWLVKRSWILRLPYQKDLMKKDIEFSEWFDGEFTKQEVFIKGYLFMENPDLWVAKAVVRILEREG